MEERIDDLVSRMTLEEKVGQLMYDAPAIPRLGVPKYNWWNEALHGVARNGRATVFPQAIGMAAAWDVDLLQRVASAIGDEARAKYNVSVANDFREIYQGLTFWSPNVNIFRDPRWGRGHETYGEDPYLTSRMGVAFVKGLQGDDPNYLKAAACAKHFAVHSGPEELRHEFDAVVSMKDMWETYLPAFEALVTEARVEAVMGAYNRVNGAPCSAHPYLMGEVLRGKWKFDGYYVSDCWAIRDFYQGHNIVENAAEAAALALNEGCDLNCGSTYPSLIESVAAGLTTEAMLEKNLKQLLKTRFRLGLFDPEDRVPFNTYGPDLIATEENRQLAREIATKGVVLLKNEDNALPIAKDLAKVYVTGPTATHMQALLANYYGVNENMVTLLEGIVGKTSPQTKVNYRQGALLDRENVNPIDWHSGEATTADVTIACVGISQLIEGEEGESIASPHKGDREQIGLPENQVKFLKLLRSKAKKLVVVMTGGSPIACPEVYDLADAFLFVWYPGQEGGNAVADVIFGDVSPSGRVPLTFPKSLDDLPPYEDYRMAGRTYRYMEKEPLFPFGFGLSYSAFEYSGLNLSSKSIDNGDSITATVNVKNTGSVAAAEVVQLYVKDVVGWRGIDLPKMALKGFQRVHLAAGESRTVSFEIPPSAMEMVDQAGERYIQRGEFHVMIGGSAPTKRSLDLGAPQWQSSSFNVR